MRIAICDDCTEDALSLKNYMKSHEASVYADTDNLLEDVENIEKPCRKQGTETFLSVPWTGREHSLRKDSVYQQQGTYLYICCTDGIVQECKGRLSELAMKVCGNVFMRCQKHSCLPVPYPVLSFSM